MRWLILKDLQILRRSPLLVGLLAVYAVAIAVLIGTALRDDPGRPKVAYFDQVPAGEAFSIGAQRLDTTRYARSLFRSIEPVPAASRAAAIEKVREGEVLAALIVPEDIVRRLQGAINLADPDDRPTLEVVYNGANPLQTREVESVLKARLADANQALSDRLARTAARYLDVLLRGGSVSLLGREFDVLGLQRSRALLDAVLTQLPRRSPQRPAVDRVRRFADVAIGNLDLAQPLLRTLGAPLAVKRTVLEGRRTPEDRYYVAIALTMAAMLVGLLVAAGMLALEREDNTFGRLVRGLVSPLQLVAAKVVLGALAAFVVAVAMAAGIAAFVPLEPERVPLWLAAVAGAAVAFAATGVALGALAKETRAASLLAVLIALPVAFLALVPQGAVSAALWDVVRALSAPFAFRPSLQTIDGALNGGDVGLPVVHLAIVTAVYLLVARLAVRRLA